MLVFYTQTITLLQTMTLLQTITLTEGLHPLYWKESQCINLFDLQSQSRTFSDILFCHTLSANRCNDCACFPPYPTLSLISIVPQSGGKSKNVSL